MKQNFRANLSDSGANPRTNLTNPPKNPTLNEVESYMNQKGVEYRTIDKSRSKRIYERLKPHIALPKRTIQVLGTNGKGSTGRFLALMLMQNGAKVLHFTSPHIFSFSERFYKNGAVVGDSELLRAHRFLQSFDFMAECSYFEYATFLACVLAQGVDYFILEAGVGGELDSTSVIPRDLCVFSVIDYDHTEILGESIEEIATTKLNAVFYPNKVPKMILGAQKYAVVEKIAKEIARAHNVEFYSVESHKNSSLGAPFALVENFGEQQTPSLVLSPKFSTNTKFTPQILELDLNKSVSNDSAESSLQESALADSWQSKQNNSASAHRISPDSWCKKSESKGAVVPPADFLLEKELRGSPPKSEKAAAFWRVGGAGRGVQPFLRKENSDKFLVDSNADLSAKSRKEMDSKFALDSRDLDSSLTAFAQNDDRVDCFGQSPRNDESNVNYHESGEIRGATHDSLDCFGDESHCNDAIQSYLTKHHLADFLAQNLNLALKALEILGFSCDLNKLPKLDLRGRFEQIAPNIIIDVGHNQNAAFAIRQNLGQKKVILVYNSYFQKNISEILGILKDNILRVEILRVADNPRIIEQKSLEQTLETLGILYQNFSGIDSIDSSKNYLVFGSFSVVEAFMRDYYKRANQK